MFAAIDFNQILDDAILFLIKEVPKVVLILVLAFIAIRIVRFSLRRLTKYIEEERDSIAEQRKAKTLVSIISSIAGVAIYIIAVVMILNELGINIAPILAGVGIIGLAIGFGAQTLVKDVISGFFILLENQFLVGEFVCIGDKSGTVEAISLRATRLRDFEGMVHYIPNGEIKLVSNYSREWARAIIDVDIPRDENHRRVMGELSVTGAALKASDEFGPMLLEEPQIVGLENLGDAMVRIRAMVRTKAANKFDVLREFRTRIKETLDTLGVENPKVETAVWMMGGGGKTAGA
jgi:small-conductance mechanosensitive channel